MTSIVAAAPVVLAQPTGRPIAGVGTEGGLSLSPSEQTVQVLTNLTLEVLADCGTHADSAGVEVTYDPAYLQVVTVTADQTSFPVVLRNRFNTPGIIYYDAGSLTCHGDGNCPAGVIRLATVTFRAVASTLPTSGVSIRGQVVWAGEPFFDGEGSGSTITITPLTRLVYLPLVMRGHGF